MRKSQPGAGPTYLPDVARPRKFVKPASYSFSVDGDLVAKNLEWHGWGEAKATAFGTIAEQPASGLLDTFPGSVTASAPRACKGRDLLHQGLRPRAEAGRLRADRTDETRTPCG